MVKANELRIGNWVIDNITKAHGQVNHISNKDDDIYTPIILTDEILLKCRFKYQNILKKIYFKNVWLFNRFRINETADNGIFYYKELKVDSLHKLQNLYFCLTGEELNITLD